MKTADLAGALLDYWTALAGEEWKTAHQHYPTMTLDPTFSGVELRNYPRGPYGKMILTCVLIPRNPMRQDVKPFCPSIAWEHGGPIIERDGIMICREGEKWGAIVDRYSPTENLASEVDGHVGSTPLIAAMRTKVASVYGAEVPDIQATA